MTFFHRLSAALAGAIAAAPFGRVGRPLILLATLALLVLTPGIASLPVTDRDEALYVQATRQMLETGDWLDIRFQDAPRYKKPIGIYWLQGVAAIVTGHGADAPIWVYRLPSLVGATAVVLFTYALATLFAGPATGLIAALLCLSTFTLGFEARLAKTDAMLAATLLAALYALARVWLDPERRRRLGRNALFWTAMGAGILIKGPIAPLIAGLTIAALCLSERRLSLWRALAPAAGLSWLLVLVLPWLAAIAWISNGAFFAASVGQDLLGKVARGQQGHGAPPGTYLVLSLAVFWPLAALIPALLASAWRRRDDARVRFLLAWVVPNWLLFELVATKLPNYLLPFMPALAVMAALSLRDDGDVDGARRLKWPLLWLPLGAVVLTLGLSGAFWHYQGQPPPLGWAVALVGIALAWRARTHFSRDNARAGAAATLAAAAVIFGAAYAILLPAASEIWLSDRIANAVAAAKTCDQPTISVTGYGEPSLVVRLGTATALVDAATAAERFRATACGVAVVEARAMSAFRDSLRQLGAPAEPAMTVTGRNLGDGKHRAMHLFVK